MERRMLLATGGFIPTDYILSYDFNGDYLDKSVNALHGIKTGTAIFETGSKPDKQCITFNGGCVRTPSALPLNSDKVTVSLGVKIIHNVTAIIAELSSNYNSNNAFLLSHQPVSGVVRFIISSHLSQYNTQIGNTIINDGKWYHIVATIDRSLGFENQNQIFNNARKDRIGAAVQEDQNGNFTNNTLFIGQRNASSLPFVGSIQNFKVFNRIINQAEILGLRSEIF